MPRKNNEPARVPTCHPDRKHLAKGMCKPCYDSDYGYRNREQTNKKAREWAAANPEKRLATRRKYLYGASHTEVDLINAEQGGVCKLCRKAPAKDLDHDHKTGAIRGLLCGPCNRGLGHFNDNQHKLLLAVEYLGTEGVVN